jgi:RNA polymerase sigma-70 factor (ECF subfamily)
MAYRKALDAGRSERRRRAREAQADQLDERAPSGTANDRMDLDRAFQSLSTAQKAVAALCWGDGYTHAEAAEALNMPAGTVKSHLLRARERLRLSLGVDDGHE